MKNFFKNITANTLMPAAFCGKGENGMTVRQQILFLIEKYFWGESDTSSYTSYLVKLYQTESCVSLYTETTE